MIQNIPMGWLGLKIAELFGQRIPSFANQTDAETYLLQERDRRLRKIVEASKHSSVFTADFTPESLKTLEAWYFRLWEAGSFEELDASREEFERWMAMYFCEVVVRNCPGSRWEVREFAFQRGKYEIGIQKGLTHLMRSRFADHYKVPNNKRRQRIFREFEQYAN